MPSRARLMASSATRWVGWRTKVKAHVSALICPSHRMLLGLWVAIGALVASAPGVQAEGCHERLTVPTTPQGPCFTHPAHNPEPPAPRGTQTRSLRLHARTPN